MLRSTIKGWRAALTLAALAGLLTARQATGQASPYRGLWVGTATLDTVNEVSIPLDADNVARASDPRVPIPSFDAAQLRLLLHVNGAGQVSLLKDVAILNRVDGSTAQVVADAGARESDLALVTDPRLYAEFPPQPAIRMGSAAFDFGDARATEALDVMVEESAQIATAFALDPSLEVDTQAQRIAARDDAVLLIQPVLTSMAAAADVGASFSAFVGDFPAVVDAIVAETADVAALLAEAGALRDASFFGDPRPVDMINDTVAAATGASPDGRQAAARNMAAAYADTGNTYQRFISGQVFGDMIVSTSVKAGTLAGAAASAATLEADLRATDGAAAAITRALQIKILAFEDSRGEDAIDAVLAAIAETAFANRAGTPITITRLAEAAGRGVLSDLVARYPVPAAAPTLDYTAFVHSDGFLAAPATAATAAAMAAINERAVNPLHTEWSVYSAARLAAVNALRNPYIAAARAMRSELPLTGRFAPGAGDPRRIAALTQPTDLGPAGLTGRIYLPAGHPTNPFRHRRHPDHTQGFNIERLIRLDFDGAEGDPLQPARQGVDRVTGTYREELFGLHKPLGPDPENAPIGLLTEGRFELNRISNLDTLNTR